MKREISCKQGEFIENVEDAVLSIFHRDAPYWIALWVVRLSICQYFSYVERYINGEHHQKCVRTCECAGGASACSRWTGGAGEYRWCSFMGPGRTNNRRCHDLSGHVGASSPGTT